MSDVDALFGKQTRLALNHFAIGTETFPREFIRALGLVKRCAAQANIDCLQLEKNIGLAIAEASLSVINGEHDQQFPLTIWQSGSGTQTHMNTNEVIANLATQLLDSKIQVHPNDHCNMGQSTNDSFSTAMHIATVEQIKFQLLPALIQMQQVMAEHSKQWQAIIKIGRTHLQDATPLTLGQQFSAYASQLQNNIDWLKQATAELYAIPQGGTAVGSGLNCSAEFAENFARQLSEYTDLPFTPSYNKLSLQAAHDGLVNVSGILNTLAVSLNKIAADIRLLGSGPRCGIGELHLPENEPGSSIMPGKVNPTQCESMLMVCAQVMGNHLTITLAGSQGQLELNTYKPLMIFSLLQSIRLLKDVINSFTEYCLRGLEPDRSQIEAFLNNSLMLVTVLSPVIGYDQASLIAQQAHSNGTTLREEAVRSGLITAEAFDELIKPENMLGPR
ncbi:MAG: class II fumarate hydratase [Methylophaga sp.]|uniref:class II fumarate hydratase n=1 Tax=Methylophaga sp. TaxID=2024840 RepID=UPI000C0DCBBC|nr:class II fumarate hydratase [Methylophaga sp.]MBL1459209.1 class II fumarate hydratase [Methylophaga sp.]